MNEQLEKLAIDVSNEIWGMTGKQQRKFVDMIIAATKNRWEEQIKENTHILDMANSQYQEFLHGEENISSLGEEIKKESVLNVQKYG